MSAQVGIVIEQKGANENLRKVQIKPVPVAGLSDDWGVPEGVPGSVGCAVVSSLARLDFRPSLPPLPGISSSLVGHWARMYTLPVHFLVLYF